MIEEPPAPIADAPPVVAEAGPSAAPLAEERTDGTLVIDLTRLAPPSPPDECDDTAPDPFQPEIVVCTPAANSQRLGPMVGPVDDGFGSAIPRARIRLSDKASAEANVHNAPVGGFNANGGEVRLKIGF